jgi:acetyl-CoA carboxylase beta subunit
MIDMVVQRQDMRATLARVCSLLMRRPRLDKAA